MRLLFLTDWTYPCDHRFLTRVYAQELTDDGHDIVWVMREGDETGPGRYEWNGNPVCVLPRAAYDPARWLLGRAFPGSHPVRDVYDRCGPFDAVQVRNDVVMAAGAARLAADEDLVYVHQQSHLKAETLLEGPHGSAPRWATATVKGTLGRRIRRRYLDRADVVLPISHAMAEYLREVEGHDGPMTVITTGADTTTDPGSVDPDLAREAFGIDADHLLLYMGTFAPVRRLEFLFDVLVALDGDAELVLAGGREEENRARLAALARDRGVADITTFTGWVGDDELLDSLVAAATVGLSPIPPDTVLRTNAPIKVLEYLAMETPVVATDTPDQRRVLEVSGAGRATAHEPAAFAAAVEELLAKDPGQRAAMGRRGREYVREHRSFEVLADQVRDVYRSCGVLRA